MVAAGRRSFAAYRIANFRRRHDEARKAHVSAKSERVRSAAEHRRGDVRAARGAWFDGQLDLDRGDTVILDDLPSCELAAARTVPDLRAADQPVSKIDVEARGEKVCWTAIAAIGEVFHVLIVERDSNGLRNNHRVKDFDCPLRRVVQSTVTDQEAQAALGEEGTVRRRDRIHAGSCAHRIVWPPPTRSLQGKAARERPFDITEGTTFAAPVVKARVGKGAQIVRDGLLKFGIKTALAARSARRRRRRRIVHIVERAGCSK